MILHLCLVIFLCLAMIAISWHAPSNTYCYAQLWQIQVSTDQANGGSLLLAKVDNSRDQEGNYSKYARKPQLYAWILTAFMKLTGKTNDLVFRSPTIISFIGLAVLVYFLASRWYSATAGLAASCFLVTSLHMGKLSFLATTDMLLAFLITACIFCADRLTFHRCKPANRTKWILFFWVSMILAALAKGWGIVSIPIVCGFLAMAGAMAPGFKVCRRLKGLVEIRVLAVIAKRWWRIIRSLRLISCLLLLAAILIPLWIAMLGIGGQAFRDKMYFEIVQRITGEGEHPPHTASGPMLAHLYYNLLPLSVFAGCAFFMTRIRWSAPGNSLLRRVLDCFRSWLNFRSPIALPLWWIITVVTAFAIPSGFRPDYLLPCYPAAAILAGWVVVEIGKDERWQSGLRHLRRICQFTPVVLAAGCIAVPVIYLFGYGTLKWIPSVAVIKSSTWYILTMFPVVGLLSMILVIISFRKRSVLLAAMAAIAAMPGILFFNSHLFCRQARYGDGDVMVHFAEQASDVVRKDPFIIYRSEAMGFQAYHGRLGRIATGLGTKDIERGGEKWLVTTDRGLLELGAYKEITSSAGKAGTCYKVRIKGTRRKFITYPEEIGKVRVVSPSPIFYENWGRIYLIERSKTSRPSSPPLNVGYITDGAI